jgi:hypothetical protein
MTNPNMLWIDPTGVDKLNMYVGHGSDTMDYLNMDVSYTRTDISQARIKELEAALKKATGALGDIDDGEPF